MSPTEARELAVRLRLSGKTLNEAAAQAGLSPPTVAALVAAYQQGGWDSVRARKRGRPEGGKRDAGVAMRSLKDLFLALRLEGQSHGRLLSSTELAEWLSEQSGFKHDDRKAKRQLAAWGLMPPDCVSSASTLFSDAEHALLWARGPRGELFVMPSGLPLTDDAYCTLFKTLKRHFPKGFEIALDFGGLEFTPQLDHWLTRHPEFRLSRSRRPKRLLTESAPASPLPSVPEQTTKASWSLTHLQRLEAEAIHIFREVVAEAENPVMLYSIGKDSSVLLRLAMKAFYPAKIPFPLLHVDTTWKFKDMYRFRDDMQQAHGFQLLIHTNQEGLEKGINPFTHGSQIHTDIMKTQALRQALDHHGFDVAIGGARRDEETSRAKERMFSFRTKDHRWDPKNQRPELWNLYNAKKHRGESIRVFPISNWTELDVWQYICAENIPIVPLYFSAPRPVVNRDGTLIMVDDERMPLAPGEVPMLRNVRFRTLGCYPLTGAVVSKAKTVKDIIQETLLTRTSERQGRVIDHDGSASMERKKQEGYF